MQSCCKTVLKFQQIPGELFMILQKEKKNFSQKLKVNDKFLTNPVEIVNNFILHLVYDFKKTILV